MYGYECGCGAHTCHIRHMKIRGQLFRVFLQSCFKAGRLLLLPLLPCIIWLDCLQACSSGQFSCLCLLSPWRSAGITCISNCIQPLKCTVKIKLRASGLRSKHLYPLSLLLLPAFHNNFKAALFLINQIKPISRKSHCKNHKGSDNL